MACKSYLSKVGIERSYRILLYWRYHTDCIPELWYPRSWSIHWRNWSWYSRYGRTAVHLRDRSTKFAWVVAGPRSHQHCHRSYYCILDHLRDKVRLFWNIWCSGADLSYREIGGEWAFRLPFLLQMIPALMVGCGIHFFPFSPRWLAMRHRDEDSLASLSKLRRLPKEDKRVQQEWKEILCEVRFQEEIVHRTHPHSNALIAEINQFIDLLRPKYIKRTAVALGIPFFQQVSYQPSYKRGRSPMASFLVSMHSSTTLRPSLRHSAKTIT